jgi:multisubunit Na+/H+ antiporter MnhB subunit
MKGTRDARLARVNPTAAFLGALVVVLVGLFAPGVFGGLVLLALAAGMIYLLRRTWPITAPRTRTIRLIMLGLLLLAALFKVL